MLIHGNNLEQKESHQTKYNDAESKRFLAEIRVKYDIWKVENEKLKGPIATSTDKDVEIVAKRVQLLNDYKDFVDQQHYAEKFDSRSNLHSSILEEFMFYLFRDLVYSISKNALIGKSHSFKDVFFRAGSFKEMVKSPCALFEVKDHDFAIGASVKATMLCKGETEAEIHDWDIPAIAIECKTYLDKTMLQDVSTAAEQLKQKNPNAMYIVIAEWLKLTESVNLKKYKLTKYMYYGNKKILIESLDMVPIM